MMVNWTKAQLAAIYSRDKNIIVSASAGSGKTSVMIERIAALISEGYALSDMLIVTFTRAAAGDMKDKLAKRLSGCTDAHAKGQLKLLSAADIGTLHSWCQRVVLQYFYKTDLDPDFGIMEPAERAALFNESLTQVIEEEYSAADPDFLDFTEILGGRDENRLKETLQAFYNHLIIRPDFITGFGEAYAEAQLKEMFKARQNRLIKDAESLYYDTLAAKFTRNCAAAEELVAAARQCKKTVLSPRGGVLPLFIGLNERYKTLKEKTNAFIAEVAAASESMPPSEQYLQVLTRMATRLKAVFSEQKRGLSKADFNDLEHYALEILRGDAGQEIRDKYKFVFVDEYQDINPLQDQIIARLDKGSNLFLVGDLKQSIYAFRGCEPTLFKEKIKLYGASLACEVIELNANHRSDRGILEFANSVFSRIMTDGFGGTDYAKNGSFILKRETGAENKAAIFAENRFYNEKSNALNSNNNNNNSGENYAEKEKHVSILDCGQSKERQHNFTIESKTGGNDAFCQSCPDFQAEEKRCKELLSHPKCVSIYLYQDEKQAKTGVYDLLKDEGKQENKAADIAAARVISLLQGTVTEKGVSRPVCLKDIAVLVRSGGPNVLALIKKLRSLGLTANVSDSLKLQENPQILALIEYLRLIDNRLDDTALINSLKSGFGGFLDEELGRIRRASPDAESFYTAAMNYGGGDKALAQKLKEFYFKLDYYRGLSQSLSVEELIGRVVTDFKYFQRMFLEGEAAAKALEAFLDLLTGFGAGTLSEFLELSPERYLGAASAGDAVSVMTVHSAKGLEFPFVIIMDAHKRFNLSDLKEPIIIFKDSAAIKHFDFKAREALPSAGWLLNKYRLSSRQREEEMRLLYVALTRAKFGLDIIAKGDAEDCGMGSGTGGEWYAEECNSWLSWLMPIAGGYLHEIAPFKEPEKKPAVFPPPDAKLVAALKKSLDFSPQICTLPPKTYVTALLSDEDSPVYIAGGDDDRAGRIGTLYHKAMELIDYHAEFETQWDALSEEIKSNVEKSAVKAAAETLREYLRGFTVHKEQSFIADLDTAQLGFKENGSVLVQGVIDILAVKDGRAVILDFKTGAVKGSHKKQLSFYALAAEKILGVKVDKTLIYSFKQSRLIDVLELADG